MNKIELIQTLIENGRASDLLLMLEGESPYTNEASEGAPAETTLAKLWTTALYHLRFVAEFGTRSDTIMRDEKWLSAFPKEFSDWLDVGAPGISIEDLKAYLQDNSPLP